MYDNNKKIVLEYCNEPKPIKGIQQVLKIKSGNTYQQIL